MAAGATQFIERQSATPDRPFFLFLTLTAPHTPIAPSPHFIGKSEAGWYGDFVHQVDWTVGQVVEMLDKLIKEEEKKQSQASQAGAGGAFDSGDFDSDDFDADGIERGAGRAVGSSTADAVGAD